MNFQIDVDELYWLIDSRKNKINILFIKFMYELQWWAKCIFSPFHFYKSAFSWLFTPFFQYTLDSDL